MSQSQDAPQRLSREKQTISSMVALYCRGHHGPQEGLCADCAALVNYAFCRLDRCPFGEKKTPCARCQVHCYGPTMRMHIKEVMRYAGPRMLYRHPILALLHQWDKFRKTSRVQ